MLSEESMNIRLNYLERHLNGCILDTASPLILKYFTELKHPRIVSIIDKFVREECTLVWRNEPLLAAVKALVHQGSLGYQALFEYLTLEFITRLPSDLRPLVIGKVLRGLVDVGDPGIITQLEEIDSSEWGEELNTELKKALKRKSKKAKVA